jgi:hypothetical protein
VNPLGAQWKRLLESKFRTHGSAQAWFFGPNIPISAANSFIDFFEIDQVIQVFKPEQKQKWHFSDEIIDELNFYANNPEIDLTSPAIFPELNAGLQIGSMQNDYIKIAIARGPIDLPIWILTDNNVRKSVWTTPDLFRLQYERPISHDSEFVIDLLNSTFNWLVGISGFDNMHFKFDKKSYNQGQKINITGNYSGTSAGEAVVNAKIYKDFNLVKETELTFNSITQRWEGSMHAPAAGAYQYEIIYQDRKNTKSQTADFQVQENQIELNDVRLNKQALLNLINAPDDQFINWESRSQLFNQINPVENPEVRMITVDLSKKWIVLFLLLGLLSTEWFYRRKIGLQ